MIEIDDFRTATSAYVRRTYIVMALSLLTMFAGFGVALAFKTEIRDFCQKHFSEPTSEMLRGLAPFPAVLVLFIGLWLSERISKQDTRLKCPHCGKMLVGMRSLVIATRNCGNCGKRVFGGP